MTSRRLSPGTPLRARTARSAPACAPTHSPATSPAGFSSSTTSTPARRSHRRRLVRRQLSFSPAVSRDALTRIRRTIRALRIHRRSDMTFAEIVTHINTYVTGWIAYYGQFYKSVLYSAFRGLNVYLMRRAMRKYKSLKHSRKKAWAWLERIEQRAPGMFAHWRLGVTASSH